MASIWWIRVKAFLGRHLSETDVETLKAIGESRLRGETESMAELRRSEAELRRSEAELRRSEAELRQAEALETLARAMREADGRVILTDGVYLAVRDGDFLGVRKIGTGAPDGVEVDPAVAVRYCSEAEPANVRELGI